MPDDTNREPAQPTAPTATNATNATTATTATSDRTAPRDSTLTTAPDEAHELIATLLATPPDQLTACPGWTAHELVAHLAAGAAEEADLIEAHLAGRPARPTRGFEERERPYRAMADGPLRERLFEASLRLAAGIERLGHDAVRFTDCWMTADDFAMHSRSECAVHRWDLVGRDDAGWAMLQQPELTRHAVSVLGSMHGLAESIATRLGPTSDRADARVVLRSEPHDDVVIEIRAGVASIALTAPADAPADLTCDPAQRLLVLWGRREPSAAMRMRSDGPNRRLVEQLLSHGRATLARGA